MHMIGHQYVGVNGYAMALCGVGEAFAVELEIIMPTEDRRTIVTPLDYVQRQVGHEKTRQARHAAA
jgi:hypothetical protein